MRIPLTLAIIPVLMIRSVGKRFAIPLVALVELLRLEADEAQNAIEAICGTAVFRFRNTLLPLLCLEHQLNPNAGLDRISANCGRFNIVVLQAEGRKFGLMVDEIHDTEEIVVKPLGRYLQISAFSGATVMGDGEIVLILDIAGLAQHAQLPKSPAAAIAEETAPSPPEQTKQLLLFQAAHRARAAVPLDSVDRLEKFKIAQFERTGERLVVQYRGELLTIVDLSAQVPLLQDRGAEVLLPVLVCHHRGRRMGIVVDRILDVAADVVSIDDRWNDELWVGAAVVQKQVTDFLDLGRVLASVEGQPRSSSNGEGEARS